MAMRLSEAQNPVKIVTKALAWAEAQKDSAFFMWVSKKAVDEARANVAALINARTEDIYFTGGGSESDNWATDVRSSLNCGLP